MKGVWGSPALPQISLEGNSALAVPGGQLDQRLVRHVLGAEHAGLAVASPGDDGAAVVAVQHLESRALAMRLAAVLGPLEGIAADHGVGDPLAVLGVVDGRRRAVV